MNDVCQSTANRIVSCGVALVNGYGIPYNLACYCSVLGRFDEAEHWFKKAILIDDKTVQMAGIDDPDSKPLWDSMSTTIWKRRK